MISDVDVDAYQNGVGEIGCTNADNTLAGIQFNGGPVGEILSAFGREPRQKPPMKRKGANEEKGARLFRRGLRVDKLGGIAPPQTRRRKECDLPCLEPVVNGGCGPFSTRKAT